VEAAAKWQRASAAQPFMWKGADYLDKVRGSAATDSATAPWSLLTKDKLIRCATTRTSWTRTPTFRIHCACRGKILNFICARKEQAFRHLVLRFFAGSPFLMASSLQWQSLLDGLLSAEIK